MPSYQPPAGFYQAPNVNYPQRPSAIGGIVDEMGLPNGVGSNMMSDPYSEEEIAASTKAPLMKAPGVPLPPLQAPSGPTVLTPSRQTPFSRADAQALAALDPRSLAEAKGIAALPESTPAKMTGSFGGQSFEMQPSARVDRNVLARLYAQGTERKGQERQDTVRGLEQGGAERLAAVPGKNAVDLARQQGSNQLANIGAEGQIQAPTRAANIRKSDQEVAGMAGNENRTQQQFAQANSPEARRRGANDTAMRLLTEAGSANDPQGQAALAALAGEGTVGSQLGANAPAFAKAVSQPSAEGQFDAYSALLNDPQITKAIDTVKANKQGFFSSGARTDKQNAAINNLKGYVQKYARAKGLSFDEVWPQIHAQVYAEH